MDIKSTLAMGDQVSLTRTNARHFNSSGITGEPLSSKENNFSDLMLSKIDNVNEAHTEVNELYQAMLTDPDSVNSDQITIAMKEAEMSLSLTKAVIDKAVSAYKEIINLR